MLSIQVKEGDNIERCLKQFKKKFDQTKTMKQLRTRREFVKPSVLNREMRKKCVQERLELEGADKHGSHPRRGCLKKDAFPVRLFLCPRF